MALEAHHEPLDLATAIQSLGLAGVNLTVPHKAAVIPDLDEIDTVAMAVWAVNTVVRRGERLSGFNTDVYGFECALDELDFSAQGTRCAVLGAGGAGRAAAYALLRRGAQVALLNRSEARGRAAAAKLRIAGRSPTVVALQPGPFADLAPSLDLVVNATAGPGRDAVLSLPVDGLPAHAGWIDLNYWDVDPPHLLALERTGHPVQTGHTMLLHQAAAAFVCFTGVSPDVEVGRAVLLGA